MFPLTIVRACCTFPFTEYTLSGGGVPGFDTEVIVYVVTGTLYTGMLVYVFSVYPAPELVILPPYTTEPVTMTFAVALEPDPLTVTTGTP